MNNKVIHVLSRAIIIDQNQILLCKTLGAWSNFYFLPGGHIEHNESAQQALLRELMEETGQPFTIKRFLGCLEYSFDSKICHDHEYNLIFETTPVQIQVHQTLPQLEPHIELEWIYLSKLNDIKFFPEPLKTLIPEWLKNNHAQNFYSKMVEN